MNSFPSNKTQEPVFEESIVLRYQLQGITCRLENLPEFVLYKHIE